MPSTLVITLPLGGSRGTSGEGPGGAICGDPRFAVNPPRPLSRPTLPEGG